MSTLNKTAIFIVSTPFQAICAVEAVYHYNIVSPRFVILLSQQHKVNASTTQILDVNNFSYNVLVYTTFGQVLKKYKEDINNLKLNLTNYDYVFLSDYFSPIQGIFGSYFFTKFSKVIYVDDGSSTIEIFSYGLKARAYSNLNLFVKTLIVNILFFLKGKSRTNFYSIFPKGIKNFDIEKNNLFKLKENIIYGEISNVYILGSNLLGMNLVSKETYFLSINRIVQHVRNNHSGNIIYYCPHRGEKSEILTKLVTKYKLVIYNAKLSVEIDFISNNIYPLALYSFGSTASYTLGMIYPNSSIYSTYLKTSRLKLNRTYKLIEKIYSNNGIETI